MPDVISRRGDLTGEVTSACFQVMVYTFMGKICIDLVQLLYGNQEYHELIDGWIYRYTLGEVLHQQELDPLDPEHYAIAEQADRSVRSDSLFELPSPLDAYARFVVREYKA